MKKNIFILCIAFFAIAFVSCSNNEPEMSPVQDGKVSFNIPAPAITADGGNQIAARKITGNLDKTSIDFKWEGGEEIIFKFYDVNEQFLSSVSHIVANTELVDKGASISFSVDAPNGTAFATAETGPEEILEQQLFKVNGLKSNHMRFETDEKIKLNAGENILPMNPMWTTIIITPDYTLYFPDDMYDDMRQHATSYIGIDQITLKQTIGDKVLDVTYQQVNSKGKPQPMKRGGTNGTAPSMPYIIVVYPAEKCDLAIDLYYNELYFYGESDSDWEDAGEEPFAYILDESKTKIQTISMHTEGQSVENLEKGQAYDVNVMSHPIDIYWVLDQL